MGKSRWMVRWRLVNVNHLKIMKILFKIFNRIFKSKEKFISPTIITRGTSKTGKTIQQHIIFPNNFPHPKSLAALLLLNNDLFAQDETFMNDDLTSWLEFRENYLKQQLQENEDLICKYCGKPHLEIGGRTPSDLILNNKNPNLATIDHIVPLTEGREKYNPKNLCVACKKCNKDKGAKSAEQFMKEINKKVTKN